MSSNNVSTKLDAVYQSLRKQHLASQVESATEMLEELILLEQLGSDLFGIQWNDSTGRVEAVQRLSTAIEQRDFETIEDEIDDVIEQLEDGREAVRDEIQRHRFDRERLIDGYIALNVDLDVVSHSRLDELSEWISEVLSLEFVTGDTLSEKLESVSQHAEMIRTSQHEIETELIEELGGEGVESRVQTLLKGDSIDFGELSDAEVTDLRSSKLLEYLEVSLGGN